MAKRSLCLETQTNVEKSRQWAILSNLDNKLRSTWALRFFEERGDFGTVRTSQSSHWYVEMHLILATALSSELSKQYAPYLHPCPKYNRNQDSGNQVSTETYSYTNPLDHMKNIIKHKQYSLMREQQVSILARRSFLANKSRLSYLPQIPSTNTTEQPLLRDTNQHHQTQNTNSQAIMMARKSRATHGSYLTIRYSLFVRHVLWKGGWFGSVRRG